MTNFDKVKSASSELAKFWSSRKDSIVFLMLLIVWIFLLCLVKKPDHQSDTENRVKVNCNDKSYINYPMASEGERMMWKEICLIFGLVWSCVISAACALRGSTKRTTITSYAQLCCRALLWIVSIFTGSVFVWLWGNNRYSETLAPNFLAACRPIDFRCSPNSPMVWVTCTTPAETWIPALSNSLPTLAAVQVYLMAITLVNMVRYWRWKMVMDAKTDRENDIIFWGLFTHAVNLAVTVATGCLIITCNEASFNIDFVSGYFKSVIVACVWVVGEYYWSNSEIEGSTLPRYWNDGEEVQPGKGQLPKNPIPSPQTPPATTGTTPGGKDKVSNPPLYPKLQPAATGK